MKDPKVTVLMSVYNGEKYLLQAVDSILNQTFSDFEFIIINDGSTDNTAKILASYNDPRIIIVNNEANIGLTKSLNKGLKLTKGKYIARMDADDISLPKRLERQVAFMDANPEIGVCGTWFEIIGDDKKSICSHPEQHDDIFVGMLFGNTIGHPTVIIRKDNILTLNEFYNEELTCAQDAEYWARLGVLGVKLANIGEVLVKYRIHERSVSKVNNQLQESVAAKVRLLQFKRLGLDPTEEELEILTQNMRSSDKEGIEKTAIWLDRIIEANRKTEIYSERSLSKVLAIRWFEICVNSCHNGNWNWKIFNENHLSKAINLTLKEKAKFFIKCLLRVNSKQDLFRRFCIRPRNK